MANFAKSASPADDTENQDVDNAAASTAQDDDTLASSPEENESEQSFEDAISEALEAGEDSDDEDDTDTGEDDDSAEGEKPKTEEADSQDPEGEADPKAQESQWDDGADVKEGQRVPYERFHKVIDQRNQMKQELEKSQPHAQEYQAIQTFMQQNELQREDVARSLQLAAMIRNDPAKALEAMQPILADLHRYTGKTLPDDLRQRVETGELSETDAEELVKTRNENQRLQQQRQKDQDQSRQRDTQQTVQRARQEMATSVGNVEAELSRKDPDFSKKMPHVRRALQEAIRREKPISGQEAAALTRKVYQQVSSELSQLVQSRRTTPPRPSSADNVRTGDLETEPDSMGEAIAAAMRKPQK